MDGVDRERVRVDEEASGSERKASNTFKLLLVCGLVVVALILTGVVYSVMPSEEGAWEGAPRWTHQLAFRREEFEHCAIDDISDQPYVVVCWSVEGGDEIRFGIGGLMSDLSSGDNPDERFLGLGISANGGMYGADIVTYSRKLGLQDRFSSSFSRPTVDPIQNVELEKSNIDGNVLSFVFKRKLLVCEEAIADSVTQTGFDLDILDNGQLTNVIWAMGQVSGEDITFHGHKMRGSLQLDLFSGDETPGHDIHTAPFKGGKEFDVFMHDGNGGALDLESAVSGTDTYMCISGKLPQVDSKKHIIEIDSVVGSTSFVHHMVLMHCPNEPSPESFRPGPCDMGSCEAMMTVWAVGGYSRYRYPDDVGFPFGESGNREYWKLQIHYNTPVSPKGYYDASGFRIRYSDPRPIDAGLHFFGWFPSAYHVIPGGKALGSDETTFEAYLPARCLSSLSKTEGKNITLFHSFLHTHKYGRKAYVQHFRDDKELPIVASQDFYDFNYQRFENPNRVLLPDDTLKLTCMYDTTSSAFDIFGGEGTENEMCLYFFSYYPRVPELDDAVFTYLKNETGLLMDCQREKFVVNNSAYENIVPLQPLKREPCERS